MSDKPDVLVSACLLGLKCRYNGQVQACEGVDEVLKRIHAIPICPEQLGGLPTPRTPSERLGDRVLNRNGEDVTEAFALGAAQALQIARLCGARWAILKARSPSCGFGEIYDGSFTGRTVPGHGMAAEALAKAGIAVFNETQLDVLIDQLEGSKHDTL